jgi:hypothetical protein
MTRLSPHPRRPLSSTRALEKRRMGHPRIDFKQTSLKHAQTKAHGIFV